MPVGAYEIIISETTLAQVRKYKQELINKSAKPGKFLKDKLKGKKLEKLTDEEFIELLIQTKKPQIYAESGIMSNGSDWNQAELRILGDVTFDVPVTIFDNGIHKGKGIRNHKNEFKGHLLFVPGALLRHAMPRSEPSPDEHDVVVNGKVDEQKLYELYERRILPILINANNRALANNKKAFIALPGIGTESFADDKYKPAIKGQFENVIRKILENNVDKLGNVQGVYFDSYLDPDAKKGTTTIGGKIDFIVQPLMLDKTNLDPAGNPQLCTPGTYGKQYENCEFSTIVAWDHVSWPGNDFYKGLRATDDGVKAAATDVTSVLTGEAGTYNKESHEYQPAQQAANWGEVIKEKKLQLEVKGRILVVNASGEQKQLRGNHTLVDSGLIDSFLSTLAQEVGLNPDNTINAQVDASWKTKTRLRRVPGGIAEIREILLSKDDNLNKCAQIQDVLQKRKQPKKLVQHRSDVQDFYEQKSAFLTRLTSNALNGADLLQTITSSLNSKQVFNLLMDNNNEMSKLRDHLKANPEKLSDLLKMKTISWVVVEEIFNDTGLAESYFSNKKVEEIYTFPPAVLNVLHMSDTFNGIDILLKDKNENYINQLIITGIKNGPDLAAKIAERLPDGNPLKELTSVLCEGLRNKMNARDFKGVLAAASNPGVILSPDKLRMGVNVVKRLDVIVANLRAIQNKVRPDQYNILVNEVKSMVDCPKDENIFTYLEPKIEVMKKVYQANQQPTLDLYKYPEPNTRYRLTENESLTIGDLHGNSLKLVHFMVLYKILDISRDDYNKLVSIFRKRNAALTKDDIAQFTQIIEKATVINRNAVINLIGDMLADRNGNDLLTLKVLEKLHYAGLKINISLSNHDAEFIKILDQLDQKKIKTTIGGGQDNSLLNLHYLINKSRIVSLEEVKSLFNNVYKPNLKLIDYDINDYGIAIRTHAGIGLDSIRNLAQKFEIPYKDGNLKELQATIDAINAKFESIRNNDAEFKKLLESESPEIKSEEARKNNPFSTFFWNRCYTNLERPEEKNGYKLYFIHGHDDQEKQRPKNVSCVDNEFGKLPNLNNVPIDEAGVEVRNSKTLQQVSVETLKERRIADFQAQRSKKLPQKPQVQAPGVGLFAHSVEGKLATIKRNLESAMRGEFPLQSIKSCQQVLDSVANECKGNPHAKEAMAIQQKILSAIATLTLKTFKNFDYAHNTERQDQLEPIIDKLVAICNSLMQGNQALKSIYSEINTVKVEYETLFREDYERDNKVDSALTALQFHVARGINNRALMGIAAEPLLENIHPHS